MIVNQPAPMLWAASVRLRMSIAREARVDGPVHVRERQDDVAGDEQDVLPKSVWVSGSGGRL